jgi:hypothetical protein
MRIVLVVSAAILVAGVLSAIQMTRSGEPHTAAAPSSQAGAATVPEAEVRAGGKLGPEEKRVASRFIVTALGRTHLAEAWELATPGLRSTVTRKQWLAGEMPIPPFPIGRLQTTGYTVVASGRRKILLQVFLVPKPGTAYNPTRYDMTLVQVDGKWRVSYLVPYVPPGYQTDR